MKDLHMLVWLTQTGISVAAPPGGFLLGAIWLRDRFGLGAWVHPDCAGAGTDLCRQRSASEPDADGENAQAEPQG